MWFFAAHIGAGYHSRRKTKIYDDALSDACFSAKLEFQQDCDENDDATIRAVTASIASLEDNPHTNAGVGSNLTEDGKVETDATIFNGRNGWSGTVAATSGIKNPIIVASTLLKESMKGLLRFNRQPPMYLAGEGAREWAKQQGLQVASEEELKSNIYQVTEDSKSNWDKYTKMVRKKSRAKRLSLQDHKKDTVGAICLGTNGNIVCGLSSGGINLKVAGRVGHAGCPGIGCFSELSSEKSTWSYSICSTGCGEEIIRSGIVRKCLDYLRSSDNVEESLKKAFLDSSYSNSNNKSGIDAGVLGFRSKLNNEKQMEIEYFAAFTTASMGIAVYSSSCQKPQIHILRSSGEDSCFTFFRRMILTDRKNVSVRSED